MPGGKVWPCMCKKSQLQSGSEFLLSVLKFVKYFMMILCKQNIFKFSSKCLKTVEVIEKRTKREERIV